jgi:hypothetical protein
MGDYGMFNEKKIVKAIYTAWNIGANLYIYTDGNWQIIFEPYQDNEYNSNLLKDYGYKMIDGKKSREIVNIKTNKVVKYKWSEVQQLI